MVQRRSNELGTDDLQVWRIATNVFFGGTGFPLIMDFFLLFRTSTALEAG